MSEKQLLVVDDEASIVTLLTYNLEQAGYKVDSASTGREALQRAETNAYDLIILDLMIPDIDGWEVCRRIRQHHRFIPILMLTAKDDEFDKVLGLEMGADDYMTKPFSPREVVARIRAILRLVGEMRPAYVEASEEQDPEKALQIDALKVYPEQYEAYMNEELLELTPKEFELLLYFLKNAGRVLSREQLLNAVWNYEFAGDTRIVDVHISHLREKIEPNPKKPSYIKTVRGLGYKMELSTNA
ncbi:two-component system alkaline phosphatase synthesis response regulator PhoP [Salsuginibacillus halophilus]|uniref:Two-component system alkaline phosphatase synthesis response regulator PhoP n=1 Tax=Salsuginibacillus halophilus TaxID=517424 RepID=A0A2P8HCW0_9BACI|nr:response regulator transcription factor [Salsuginibacillus halophilus]PSL44070.1 two-component system alkaline phosphatase synthesis response regulator PhoP [Salsuginibacillus halophilus]